MTSSDPPVWHYGLMAERWAEVLHDAPELPFFRRAIERFGQPVLDVGCGAGRLLLPLLRAGVDIDGCDVSGDMLYHCRRRATGDGLDPNLHQQPMNALVLPRRYKTIYICDSFGLAGSREKDQETLRRCHDHLVDGGALLLNIQAEYASPEAWCQWLAANRRALPEPWPEEGRRGVAADGTEHIARFRLIDLDPLEQRYTRQVQLEKWQNGRLVASEERTLSGQIYFRNELMLMLEAVGFRDATVTGDYTDDPATADHEELVFTAVR